ncbi:MAG: DUF3108 domain-containing protein [Thermodesulfovibrionia bacterium]|nr:DUF3108 domain-containing protein [Thermodesulfovibrionia bacterium]
MKIHYGKACMVYALIISCLFLYSSPSEAGQRLPENFVYHIFWSGIRAGKATMDFENTAEGIRITSHETSTSFVSLFYKVDDTTQTTLYSDGFPKSYTISISEGRHRREKATSFEMPAEDGKQKVVYRNILDKETVEFELEGKAYDALSALYELRKRPLKVGTLEYLDIFEDKKTWKTEVQVIKKERIRTPAGEFDTILIKPMFKSEGLFLKKGDVYIWLSDDGKKIPVMIEIQTKAGNFKVKLSEGAY